jgi:hypothetical protein
MRFAKMNPEKCRIPHIIALANSLDRTAQAAAQEKYQKNTREKREGFKNDRVRNWDVLARL